MLNMYLNMNSNHKKKHGTFVVTYEFRGMLGWRSKVVAIRMDFGRSKKLRVIRIRPDGFCPKNLTK